MGSLLGFTPHAVALAAGCQVPSVYGLLDVIQVDDDVDAVFHGNYF
jgi:hypothetical protein